MKIRALVAFMLSVAYAQPLQTLGASTGVITERDVLFVDHQRTKAMLQNDASTLDRILAPDVTFVTGDGALNRRADYLSDIRFRKLTYSRLDYSATSVRLIGNTAIPVSRANVEGRYDLKRCVTTFSLRACMCSPKGGGDSRPYSRRERPNNANEGREKK